LRASRRDLARLLTRVENGHAHDELSTLFPYTGQAHVIGVTGAPGTGKSTLVNALAKAYRAEGITVAVVAVDPTSPFTGGAILGDRIRMRELSGDPGTFIRSMATRGSLGGLAHTTSDVVRVFDAAGYDVILIETVGAGQSEVDIARAAQTTLVVEAPGLGDDVQAIKAGILEIADVLVVNKADRPGVEHTVRALRAMLDLGHRAERVLHHGTLMAAADSARLPALPDEMTAWQTPVVQTIASEGTGVDEVLARLHAHRDYLRTTGTLIQRERAHAQAELLTRVRDALFTKWIAGQDQLLLGDLIARIAAREMSPAQVVTRLIDGG
jgi:LAO/AO transport system kinase